VKDVQIDADGDLRCPKCGAKAFRSKRSVKAKIASAPLLIAAPLAPKRLKCLACGTLLKAGDAKPYQG